MNLEHIIRIVENKLNSLNQDLANSSISGDLARYAEVEEDISETQATLERLKSI